MATGASEVRVIAAPHPLRFDTIEAVVPGGQNIVEIMGRADLPALVWADGVLIECEHWHEVIPQEHLVIRRIPADRNVLRLLGFIAIAVFAPYAGGAIAGAFGASATGIVAGLATAGVGLAGALALNALIPPVFPSVAGVSGPQQLSAITGQSNQVAPWSPIPKVYGNPTYYPPIPMTGLPYTELVGEDQYLRMMVVLGYGPLDIGGHTVGKGHALVTETTTLTGNPIKIGGTSIDQFEDVEFQIGDPDDVTLFTTSVTETAVNVSLDPVTDPTTEEQTIADNIQVTQTTEEQTDEVSLEVYFPALFTVSGQGNTRYARVNFEVHSSPAGAGTWTLRSSFTVSSKERKPIRRGVRFVLPAAGEYDIRLTRVSTFYGQENSFFADCTWTVMRSIKRNVRPFDVDNTVVMALRIRATDQLGGRVDRLSVSATSVLPVWDGSDWYLDATRSPAWAYTDVLSGNGTKTAASQSSLDTASLLSWANWCTFHGLTFDAVIDAEGTVFDRAREIASTGMASWHVTDDAKYSVIRDEVATPKMVITPRNSFGFSSDYAYHKLPHALRVQFIDPDTWEPTERIVYDDGYTEANATRYEMLPTIGVSEPDHAWKIGRYHLAQLRLRPETYSWGQDVQHLVYQRGDTVRVANDPMLVGLKWGRITAVNSTTEIEVDELLYMEVAETYGLVVQKTDGTIVTQEIDTDSPSTQTVTFTAPVTGLTVGDHFAFGELASETILARITRIEPTGDFKAQITAVPAAENIFDAWSGAIPEFDPVITGPIDISLLPPVQPTIVDISTDSPPSPVGAPRLRMVIAFEMPPGLEGVTIEARVRTKETISSVDVFGDWHILGAVDSNLGVVYVVEVEEQITYQVQLRSRRGIRVSSWTATTEYTIPDSGWLSEPGAERNLPNIIPSFFSDFEVLNLREAYVDSGTIGEDLTISTARSLTGSRSLKFTCAAAGGGAIFRFGGNVTGTAPFNFPIRHMATRRLLFVFHAYVESNVAAGQHPDVFWKVSHTSRNGSGGQTVNDTARDIDDFGVDQWAQVAVEFDTSGYTYDPTESTFLLTVSNTTTLAGDLEVYIDGCAVFDVTDYPELVGDYVGA